MFKIKTPALEPVDRLVEMGRKYGLHVSLNFHRAPGYGIDNAGREPFILWSDKRAEDAFDLSFNLLNEAPKPREGYMAREDGLEAGNKVVEEMIRAGVAQSVPAHSPGGIGHYRASWVDKESKFPAPWAELARKVVGVHCGECGGFNRTPHDVFLAWFTGVMDILAGHGIGWALRNFRGSFGMLDSGRAGVAYEDRYGRPCPRALRNEPS